MDYIEFRTQFVDDDYTDEIKTSKSDKRSWLSLVYETNKPMWPAIVAKHKDCFQVIWNQKNKIMADRTTITRIIGV